MTSLSIDDSSIPDLTNVVALITGGSSGIGFAAARILLSKNAIVQVLDVNEPSSDISGHIEALNAQESFHFHHCNVASWMEQLAVFDSVGRVDLVFANAGVGEAHDYFTQNSVAEGREPDYASVLDTNLIGVLHTLTLARRSMSTHSVRRGSVVITISAVAYAPEQSLPVYTASKLALVGLVRSLRSTMLLQEGITINGVAPAATVTSLLPPHLAAPIVAMGLPISEAGFVARALVYSATAKQLRKVEVYGKESDGRLSSEGGQERWNGRVILTLGDRYTEFEGSIADLKPFWFGQENLRLTRAQQAATDFREKLAEPQN